MIDLIAAALGFGVIGYAAGAVMTKRTLGKVADMRTECGDDCTACAPLRKRITAQEGAIGKLVGLRWSAERAHTRCADALGTTQRKLSAIRDLLDTPRTIRKGALAAILDGDA